MIKGDAKQFLDNLTNNPSLQAAFRASGAENAEIAMDFALSRGYVFTESELRAALTKYPDQPLINELRKNLKISRAEQIP